MAKNTAVTLLSGITIGAIAMVLVPEIAEGVVEGYRHPGSQGSHQAKDQPFNGITPRILKEMIRWDELDRKVEIASQDSFPASDPPGFTH